MSTTKPFSQNDAGFFYIILMNMKTTPQADWIEIAKLCGYSSAKSAQTRFGQIKKKFQSKDGNRAALSTPKLSPGKRKADDEPKTPVSRKRGKKTVAVDDVAGVSPFVKYSAGEKYEVIVKDEGVQSDESEFLDEFDELCYDA